MSAIEEPNYWRDGCGLHHLDDFAIRTIFEHAEYPDPDLTSVLIGAGLLEDLTRDLMLPPAHRRPARGMPHPDDLVFKTRIAALYEVGVIQRVIRADLDTIRHIRNRFAHWKRPVMFATDPGLQSLMSQLRSHTIVPSPFTDDDRERFTWAVAVIAQCIYRFFSDEKLTAVPEPDPKDFVMDDWHTSRRQTE